MERLTSNVDYCETYCENNKNSCPIYSSCINRKSYELAKVYEDAEEQGLLLRLSCKIGSTIYEVYQEVEYCVSWWDIREIKFTLSYYEKYKDKFGKTIFLTTEEAEQALKQMGE